MRRYAIPASIAAACLMLFALGCSHNSKNEEDQPLSALRMSVQAQEGPLSLAANPANVVIDTTNPSTPVDGNGKFTGTSALTATVHDDAGAPVAGASVSFSTTGGTLASNGAAVTTDAQGLANDTLTVNQDTTSPVTVTATSGELSVGAEVTITVVLPNQPPVADAGPDRNVECSSPDGTPVSLDGSHSSDPDSTAGTNDDIATFEWLVNGAVVATGATAQATLPTGTTTVTLRVTDKAGATATDDAVITVADTIPPELRVSTDPESLWPPNHKLRDVHVHAEVVDACTPPGTIPPPTLVSVSSNEPDNGLGDGDTENDIQGADLGTADDHLLLRAERSGGGHGRIYTLVYSMTDPASGAATEQEVEVRVPHDQGH